MTDSAVPQPEAASFLQVWAESLAQVLGQISGKPLPCFVLPQAPPQLASAGDRDLWIVGASTGSLRGEMSLRLTPASVLRLAQVFMSEPPSEAASGTPSPEPEVTADHREAALELLRQVAGIASTALKTSWGEVQLRIDTSAGAPSWPASCLAWLRAGEDVPEAAVLELHLSAALVAALRAGIAGTAKTVPSAVPSGPPSAEENQGKLDLLMDVELALTLRFGSRRMLLREVLDLIPGAVVDLDRQVQEPVDVLLDGRLVARGEVVVLDGNYGVRVTEVAPAGQ